MKIYDPKTGQNRTVTADDMNRLANVLAGVNMKGAKTIDRIWYKFGVALKPIISEYIDGRFTMSANDAGALMRAVAMSPGDYVEIEGAEKAVRTTLDALGLKETDGIRESYATLIGEPVPDSEADGPP